MESSREEPTVLLADDEPALVEVYEVFLEDTCDVITATDGVEVLELLDESIDIVLLDRRMPATSGDEALETLRERGYDVPVGLISGIEPDFDIIEMPVDDYLTKPIDRESLRETVERLAARVDLDDQCRELLRLDSKKAALEAAGAVDEGDSEEFQNLLGRIEEKRADLELD